MVIYKITNMLNGMLYVGQTRNSLRARFNSHCAMSENHSYLARAIRKHGRENFKIEVIEICMSIEQLNEREAYHIRALNTLAPDGYNLIIAGTRSTVAEETRLKLSAARLAYLEKHGPSKDSEETRARKSAAATGRVLSSETIGKIIANTAKLVFQYSLEGIFMNGFSSGAEAYRQTGIFPQIISSCCRGKVKSGKGYRWSFFKLEKLP